MNIPLRPISPVGCVDGVQFSLSLSLMMGVEDQRGHQWLLNCILHHVWPAAIQVHSFQHILAVSDTHAGVVVMVLHKTLPQRQASLCSNWLGSKILPSTVHCQRLPSVLHNCMPHEGHGNPPPSFLHFGTLQLATVGCWSSGQSCSISSVSARFTVVKSLRRQSMSRHLAWSKPALTAHCLH